MKYKLAIFDMDGTILNTLDDLTDSCNVICQKYGFPTHTTEEFKFFVGNGIPKMIERALPKDISQDLYKKILSEYIEYYQDHCAIKTKAYEGLIPLIKKLKENGVITAVNTNKVESAAIDLCNDYFPALFDIISGSRPGMPPKPAPDGIFEILERAGMSKEDASNKGAVFIGDSDVDMQTGINASLDVIGVDWGFRGEAFLREKGAKLIAKNPQDIFDIFNSQ